MQKHDSQAPLTDVTVHSPDELTALRQRRSALQEMARIALSVEKLRQGLSALLLVGKPPDDLPDSALTLFETLSKSVRHYSDRRLRESLDAIEKVVQDNVERILAIADAPDRLDSAGHDSGDPGDLHALIHEFRRHVQTAVALGLLLHERGIACPEFRLPVSHEVISTRIGHLIEEEKRCRNRLETEMSNMLDEIGKLENTLHDERITLELRDLRRQLLDNLAHLRRGENIEDMPVVFEMIEMGSAEDHRIPFTPTSLPSAPPTETASHANESVNETDDTPPRRPFGRRLWTWLTTPLGVRWRDID